MFHPCHTTSCQSYWGVVVSEKQTLTELSGGDGEAACVRGV